MGIEAGLRGGGSTGRDGIVFANAARARRRTEMLRLEGAAEQTPIIHETPPAHPSPSSP